MVNGMMPRISKKLAAFLAKKMKAFFFSPDCSKPYREYL